MWSTRNEFHSMKLVWYDPQKVITLTAIFGETFWSFNLLFVFFFLIVWHRPPNSGRAWKRTSADSRLPWFEIQILNFEFPKFSLESNRLPDAIVIWFAKLTRTMSPDLSVSFYAFVFRISMDFTVTLFPLSQRVPLPECPILELILDWNFSNPHQKLVVLVIAGY